MNVCFCCVTFSFFPIPSQEIGSWKHPGNDPFCVEWDVKPQLNRSVNLSFYDLALLLCRRWHQQCSAVAEAEQRTERVVREHSHRCRRSEQPCRGWPAYSTLHSGFTSQHWRQSGNSNCCATRSRVVASTQLVKCQYQ